MKLYKEYKAEQEQTRREEADQEYFKNKEVVIIYETSSAGRIARRIVKGFLMLGILIVTGLLIGFIALPIKF